MKILFDSQVFNWQLHGGISRYFVEINKAMRTMGEASVICAPMNINQYLLGESGKIGFTTKPFQRGSRHIHQFNRNLCNLFARIWRPNILHHTYYDVYGGTQSKHVLTVYDMIHEKLPHEIDGARAFIEKKRIAITSADLVIAISNATRNDILEFVDVPPEKVVTIHLAANKFDSESCLESIRTTRYLLFVGSRILYKNFRAYVNACAKLKYEGDFVFFGGGPFNGEELATIHALGIQDRAFQISGSDDISVNLYKHADLFVYPSRYEGFGIPLLEAIQLGCPVAVSDIAPFREIIGENATYFNPNSVESITKGIEQALQLGRPSSDLVEGIKKKYSWEQCAINSLNAYKTIL